MQRRDPLTVRVSDEVARHVRDGHPWVFRDALQGRRLGTGKAMDVIDPAGAFLGRAIYDPSGAIGLRVFSTAKSAQLDERYLEGALRRAARLRRAIADPAADGCFRVIAGDSEGVPAVNVDRYGPYLVVLCYSAVVEAFEEPLLAALRTVWRPRGIYVQRRYRATPEGKARPGGELAWGEAAPPEVVVVEGRARFVVDVSAPLGTGFFADMRLGRAAVARLAPGRRVLNCFSYTGAFTVVAGVHGALGVTSIDAAPRAHGRARRNLSENGIDQEDRAFEFVTGDVFATLARLASRGARFDLVILDPPSFSTSKGRAFATQTDYADLTAAALEVLSEDGMLVAATNTAKLGAAEFDRAIARGAAQAGRRLAVIERHGAPADCPAAPGFPEGSYLKIVVARVLA